MNIGSVDSILIIVIFLLLMALVLFSWKLRRIREQISDMEEILKDIQQGNGNRRILLPEQNNAASLAYRMNEIVYSYEKKLVDLKRIEKANKELMTSLSHDVRTPLTTLIGYLDAAHRSMVTGQEREEYIGIANRKAADKVEITLTVRGNKEDRVEVSVRDNGVGIADASLEYVFERLYKCDKGRSGKGSGLGLSIIRQITEKMGGTVSVRSKQGKYCEFLVEFALENV